MKKLILFSLSLALNASADWPQFRGPQGNGVTTDKNLPVTLSPKSLNWSVELPGRG